MKESFTLDGNGDLKELEVVLDVLPFEDYATTVSFAAPEDGTKKVYTTIAKNDFDELGQPGQITVTVSPA